jgi:hypothetical protein
VYPWGCYPNRNAARKRPATRIDNADDAARERPSKRPGKRSSKRACF